MFLPKKKIKFFKPCLFDNKIGVLPSGFYMEKKADPPRQGPSRV